MLEKHPLHYCFFANWAYGKFKAMMRHARIHSPSNNYESQRGAERQAFPKIVNRPEDENYYEELKFTFKKENNSPQIMLKMK